MDPEANSQDSDKIGAENTTVSANSFDKKDKKLQQEAVSDDSPKTVDGFNVVAKDTSSIDGWKYSQLKRWEMRP